MNQFLIITAFLVALAFWRRDIVLYIIAIPACLMTGFKWFNENPTDEGFVIASAILAIGIYSFYKVAENLIERIKN